jgi:hypothetical protein
LSRRAHPATLRRVLKQFRVWTVVAAVGFVLAGCVQGAQPSGSVQVPRSSVAIDSSTPGASRSASGAVATYSCPGMTASADYCRRLAAWMRQQTGLSTSVVLRLEELPPPSCMTTFEGQTVMCAYGGGPPRTIRATTDTGARLERTLPCLGVSLDAICSDTRSLQVESMRYWDVPCEGEPPAGCATPVVPDASTLNESRPLLIRSLDVPVGPIGHREVEIGRAIIPNGILSKARFTLAPESQTQNGFLIDPELVRMQVVSLDPTRPPFTNVYERGRFPGVEEVKVLLVFDVAETSDSGVLHIENVEVR